MSAQSDFLAAQNMADLQPTALAGDASSRQYFRLLGPGGKAANLLLMDAGVDLLSALSFRRVGGILMALGLSPPLIRTASGDNRFMLIEDFGDDLFANFFDDAETQADLIELATKVLITLRQRFDPKRAADLPSFDPAMFKAQAGLFPTEISIRSKGDEQAARFDQAMAPILDIVAQLPQTLILRDYHGENLIWLPKRSGEQACGLLDFQDAGIGPIGYDLVSLLEDARRNIAPACQTAAMAAYRAQLPPLEAEMFTRAYPALAIIRHLRVIAVFLRLARHGKRAYLRHLPRLWHYLDDHLRDPMAKPLQAWIAANVPSEIRDEAGVIT